MSVQYEKELSYASFRDNLAFKRMIGARSHLVKSAYLRGKQSAETINLVRKTDSTFNELMEVNGTFQQLVIAKSLVSPFGSIAQQLLQRQPCLLLFSNITTGSDSAESQDALKQFDSLLLKRLIDDIDQVEAKLESFDIESLLLAAKNSSLR